MKAYLEAYYPDLLMATDKATALSGKEEKITEDSIILSGNEDETTDEAITLSGNENNETVTIGGNTWIPLWAVLWVHLIYICRQNFD